MKKLLHFNKNVSVQVLTLRLLCVLALTSANQHNLTKRAHHAIAFGELLFQCLFFFPIKLNPFLPPKNGICFFLRFSKSQKQPFEIQDVKITTPFKKEAYQSAKLHFYKEQTEVIEERPSTADILSSNELQHACVSDRWQFLAFFKILNIYDLLVQKHFY